MRERPWKRLPPPVSAVPQGDKQTCRGPRCRRLGGTKNRTEYRPLNKPRVREYLSSRRCAYSYTSPPSSRDLSLCHTPWFSLHRPCPSQLCSWCRPRGWSPKFLCPRHPGCHRLRTLAQCLQQGIRSQTHIGRRSSEMACSSMRPRGVESYPVPTGSLGGTTVARAMVRT